MNHLLNNLCYSRLTLTATSKPLALPLTDKKALTLETPSKKNATTTTTTATTTDTIVFPN